MYGFKLRMAKIGEISLCTNCGKVDETGIKRAFLDDRGTGNTGTQINITRLGLAMLILQPNGAI